MTNAKGNIIGLLCFFKPSNKMKRYGVYINIYEYNNWIVNAMLELDDNSGCKKEYITAPLEGTFNETMFNGSATKESPVKQESVMQEPVMQTSVKQKRTEQESVQKESEELETVIQESEKHKRLKPESVMQE